MLIIIIYQYCNTSLCWYMSTNGFLDGCSAGGVAPWWPKRWIHTAAIRDLLQVKNQRHFRRSRAQFYKPVKPGGHMWASLKVIEYLCVSCSSRFTACVVFGLFFCITKQIILYSANAITAAMVKQGDNQSQH